MIFHSCDFGTLRLFPWLSLYSSSECMSFFDSSWLCCSLSMFSRIIKIFTILYILIMKIQSAVNQNIVSSPVTVCSASMINIVWNKSCYTSDKSILHQHYSCRFSAPFMACWIKELTLNYVKYIILRLALNF